MNHEKILKLINDLLQSDAGLESDYVKMDVINGRPVSDREKILADLISRIYRIVHPLYCSHPNWQAETEELLDK